MSLTKMPDDRTDPPFLAPTAHIATVGKIMATDEATAYPILRKHDVDYLLVIFGGLIGYSGSVATSHCDAQGHTS